MVNSVVISGDHQGLSPSYHHENMAVMAAIGPAIEVTSVSSNGSGLSEAFRSSLSQPRARKSLRVRPNSWGSSVKRPEQMPT